MSADAEIMVRQAGVSDTEYSALDERVGDQIAVLPGVAAVSGVAFSGTILPDSGAFFLYFGYSPNEFGIRQFNVVEGERLTSNHEMIMGRMTAEALNISVGDTLDLGGGYPVRYAASDRYPSIEEYAAPILERLSHPPASRLHIHLEPGRYVLADAGVLVLTVLANKQAAGRRAVIVDGGMNVLIRPALYGAVHQVLPVRLSRIAPVPTAVAGPVCESADYLAHDAALPPRLQRGDRLAVLNAGAYGMVMASNYNGHPLPAEVMVDDSSYRLIRRRQTYDDLTACEVGLAEEKLKRE